MFLGGAYIVCLCEFTLCRPSYNTLAFSLSILVEFTLCFDWLYFVYHRTVIMFALDVTDGQLVRAGFSVT